MNFIRIAAVAALLTVILIPSPASAQDLCNDLQLDCADNGSDPGMGNDEVLCSQGYGTPEMCAPYDGLPDWEVPSVDEQIEQCITQTGLPEDCAAKIGGDGYVPPTPAPEPEPVYEAPKIQAKHLGGCAYWHKHAAVVTCRGTTLTA